MVQERFRTYAAAGINALGLRIDGANALQTLEQTMDLIQGI